MKKNRRRQIKKNLEPKKQLKEKKKLYVKWKKYDNSFNSCSDRKTLHKMSHYYPKSYRGFSGKFSVKVDLSKYATKLELNEVTRIDTSNFALKSTLASAKTVVNETDVEKLKTVPVD